MLPMSSDQVQPCRNLDDFDTEVVLSLGGYVIGATAALAPSGYNQIIRNMSNDQGKNNRLQALAIYHENMLFRKVLTFDYVMVPTNYKQMKKRKGREQEIEYSDGKTQGCFSKDSFLANVGGELKRFDKATSVFENLKDHLQSGKNSLDAKEVLLY